MILLIPVSPEVPKLLKPGLWQGLVVVLAMGIIYLQADQTIDKDIAFVDNLQVLVDQTPSLDINQYLKSRPLLKIAPSKGDWDLRRLILANFIHGTPMHLLLNMVGVFAGIRILSTFLPFLATISIFLLGGTIGLCTSLFVTEQFSPFIPHVGASAGIFALMGAYYIYNWRFRTTYFFWYPTRRRFISLKTNWFFFMDVILMEIILSTGQRYAERLDSVDHVAHVVGFISGLGLAILLRTSQRWPQFLQTRGEYYYWSKHLHPNLAGNSSPSSLFNAWMELLEINRYNDQLKLRVSRLMARQTANLSDTQITLGFQSFNPTFVRLYPQYVADAVRMLFLHGKKIPERWLSKLPYDSLIYIAKQLAMPVEDQPLIFLLVNEYRKVQANKSSATEKKISELIEGLQKVFSSENITEPGLAAISENTNEAKIRKEIESRSPKQKAKWGS